MSRHDGSEAGQLASDDEPDVSHLLERHETVRDPIHHDIWITLLERQLIDTAAFQRLRRIAQLGTVSLVYPGAVHNRFQHSLGVLHVTEQLFNLADRNADAYGGSQLVHIAPYARLLGRLLALLHDLAHIPYGHLLEDEGYLYPPEWDDDQRLEQWLGDDSEIARTLAAFLKHERYGPDLAGRLLMDVRQYMTTGRHGVHGLRYPYVSDIVANTLSADLLDYVERDAYFCGLAERIGDRFINYVAVVDLLPTHDEPDRPHYRVARPTESGKGRFVLLTYRFEREHAASGRLHPVTKWDVLSEAMDLLRRRFSLAEKVYFHRTKVRAASMLISAAAAAATPVRDLYMATDESFLRQLEEADDPRAAHLASAYSSRRLYQPVFQLKYRPEAEMDRDSWVLWHEVYARFRNPRERSRAESELEARAGLPPGSISIYCPDRDMNLKRFEMLVQTDPNGEVKLFGDILDTERQAEMNALNKRFQQLWSLQVLVDPAALPVTSVNSGKVLELNGICESPEFFRLPNDIQELRGRGQSHHASLVGEVVEEWDSRAPDRPVPHRVYTTLLGSHRGAVTKDVLRSELEVLMGPPAG